MRLPALRFALTLLTVLPVAGPQRVDRRLAGRAVLLFPLVGLLLGLAAAVVVLVVRVVLDVPGTAVAAGLAVMTLALLTGGLHLDGLADLSDALGSRAPRARALDIMKSPTVGAHAVTAVVLVLLVQVLALSVAIDRHSGVVALVTATVTGRLAVVLACLPSVPAARPDGLGALVGGTVTRGRAVLTVLAWVTVLAAVPVLDRGRVWTGDVLGVVLAVPAGLLAASALRRLAVRRLGGVTGDVFGALVEVATLAALVVGLARPGPIL